MKYTAHCIRTKMNCGGNSYVVYIPKREKTYEPISGLSYAITIVNKNREFYRICDVLRTPEVDNLPYGKARCDAFNVIEKKADQIELKILKLAYPELKEFDKLPTFWTSWTLPSDERIIKIEIEY